MPLHCERNSLEIGSLLGGFNCTGVFGSNLPAIVGEMTGVCLLREFVKL